MVHMPQKSYPGFNSQFFCQPFDTAIRQVAASYCQPRVAFFKDQLECAQKGCLVFDRVQVCDVKQLERKPRGPIRMGRIEFVTRAIRNDRHSSLESMSGDGICLELCQRCES